jgi:hypothetical protein
LPNPKNIFLPNLELYFTKSKTGGEYILPNPKNIFCQTLNYILPNPRPEENIFYQILELYFANP